MKFNKKLFITLAIAILAGLPAAASAALIPACALGTGVPQLSCFLELGVSVSKWILGITGSLALLFFVYGGFMFLTSRGNTEQITKGKTILTQAAIGIIIIFGAYIGVNFLVNAIGGKFTTEFKIEQPATPPAPAAKIPDEKHRCWCGTNETKADFDSLSICMNTPNCPKLCGTLSYLATDTPVCKPTKTLPTKQYQCWCGDVDSTTVFTWPACETECPKQCAILKLMKAPVCKLIKTQ